MRTVNKLNLPICELLAKKEFIYFLGYIWADGYIHRNTLELEIKSDDMDNILPIIRSFSTIISVPSRKRKLKNDKLSKPLSCLRITDINLINFLIFFEFKNRKLGISPQNLLNAIENDLVKYFIHGYFDGDGCLSFSQSKGYSSLCFWSNISQNWDFIETLFKNLNLKYSIYRKTNKKNQSYSFIVSNRRHGIIRFYKFIKSEIIGLERKRNIFLNLIKNTNFEEKNKTSQYKGIHKGLKGWIVKKTVDKRSIALGPFESEQKAYTILQLSKDKTIDELYSFRKNKYHFF